jgi:hypothetical protein
MDSSSDLPALKENRPECVWQDAKHRVRDARAPLNRLCSIRSTENVDEAKKRAALAGAAREMNAI